MKKQIVTYAHKDHKVAHSFQDTNGLLPSNFLFVCCFANTIAMQ